MSSKKGIRIGSILMGNGAPVSVQSMTNTDTHDREATLNQVRQLEENGRTTVTVPTVFTASTPVIKEFEKTERAGKLADAGVVVSYICPLMYMNNPLCKKKPVITSSNKLRTYTSSRYYTEAEILDIITGKESSQ